MCRCKRWRAKTICGTPRAPGRVGAQKKAPPIAMINAAFVSSILFYTYDQARRKAINRSSANAIGPGPEPPRVPRAAEPLAPRIPRTTDVLHHRAKASY